MVDSSGYVQKSILQSIPHIYFLGNLRDMKHDLNWVGLVSAVYPRASLWSSLHIWKMVNI